MALSEDQKNVFDSKLRRLGECADAKMVDDVFDEIFSQLGDLKRISCNLAKGRLPSHGAID